MKRDQERAGAISKTAKVRRKLQKSERHGDKSSRRQN